MDAGQGGKQFTEDGCRPALPLRGAPGERRPGRARPSGATQPGSGEVSDQSVGVPGPSTRMGIRCGERRGTSGVADRSNRHISHPAGRLGCRRVDRLSPCPSGGRVRTCAGHAARDGRPRAGRQSGVPGERETFVFFRTPRADAIDPETGERLSDVIVVWVTSESEKQALVQDPASSFFTTGTSTATARYCCEPAGSANSPVGRWPCSVSWSRRRVHDDRRDAATRRSVRDEVRGLEPANLGAIRAYPGELPAVQRAGAVQDDRLGRELYAAVVAR